MFCFVNLASQKLPLSQSRAKTTNGHALGTMPRHYVKIRRKHFPFAQDVAHLWCWVILRELVAESLVRHGRERDVQADRARKTKPPFAQDTQR
jgi:hypothetical protein